MFSISLNSQCSVSVSSTQWGNVLLYSYLYSAEGRPDLCSLDEMTQSWHFPSFCVWVCFQGHVDRRLGCHSNLCGVVWGGENYVQRYQAAAHHAQVDRWWRWVCLAVKSCTLVSVLCLILETPAASLWAAAKLWPKNAEWWPESPCPGLWASLKVTALFCVHTPMPTLDKSASKTNNVSCDVDSSSHTGSFAVLSVFLQDALRHSVESPAHSSQHCDDVNETRGMWVYFFRPL